VKNDPGFSVSLCCLLQCAVFRRSGAGTDRQCQLSGRSPILRRFVVGAELTLVNTANRIEAKFTSMTGRVHVPESHAGTYELRVSKAGFENSRLTGIVITINDSARADVTLKIGAPVETVTVESETTVINYDNGTLQGGADPETLKDLP